MVAPVMTLHKILWSHPGIRSQHCGPTGHEGDCNNHACNTRESGPDTRLTRNPLAQARAAGAGDLEPTRLRLGPELLPQT